MAWYRTVDETVESLLEVFPKKTKAVTDRFLNGFIRSHYFREGKNDELIADCGTDSLNKACKVILKEFKKIFARKK